MCHSHRVYFFKNTPIIASSPCGGIREFVSLKHFFWWNLTLEHRRSSLCSLIPPEISSLEIFLKKRHLLNARFLSDKTLLWEKDGGEVYFVNNKLTSSFYSLYDSFSPRAFRLPRKIFIKNSFGCFERVWDSGEELSMASVFDMCREITKMLAPLGFTSHGDLHRGNVMVDSKNIPFLIDWDDLCYAEESYDFLHFYAIDLVRFRDHWGENCIYKHKKRKVYLEIKSFCEARGNSWFSNFDKVLEKIIQKRASQRKGSFMQ